MWVQKQALLLEAAPWPRYAHERILEMHAPCMSGPPCPDASRNPPYATAPQLPAKAGTEQHWPSEVTPRSRTQAGSRAAALQAQWSPHSLCPEWPARARAASVGRAQPFP